MIIKSSKELVDNAKKSIKSLSAHEIKNMVEKGQITLIDIRDIRELWKEGTIKDSIHIPRGMLEFWLDPNSSYYKEKKIGNLKNIVLFCALGLRSALATKTLQDMGFENVMNADGGFDSLKDSGLEVVKKEKKLDIPGKESMNYISENTQNNNVSNNLNEKCWIKTIRVI